MTKLQRYELTEHNSLKESDTGMWAMWQHADEAIKAAEERTDSKKIEDGGPWTEGQIDAAAQYLRETLQSGKNLLPWATTARATKKKWIALAEGALEAARKVGEA